MDKQATINENFISHATGSFHGGIHPKEFKQLSKHRPIDSIKTSLRLIVPLQQSIGVESKPVVSVGERVTKGQLIASSGADISANIHAPANGIIEAIEPCDTGHVSGLLKLAVIITTQAFNETTPNISNASKVITGGVCQNVWNNQTREKLLERIEQAGIVGLGGATFPTKIKLSGNNIKTLLVNAMECEPYITCDDRLLQEQANDVIEGSQIAAYIAGAQEIIFAIEDNKPEALEALKTTIISSKDKQKIPVKIIIAPTKYPSGGEKQMIELVLNQQIPKGQLPSSIGVLVQNVATLFAINNAINCNQNLTKRLVTITGDLIKQAGNYWLPFGTPLSHIIAHFNVIKEHCDKVIFGGPLMGQSVTNFDVPITKSTNCIIFNQKTSSAKDWITQSKQHQACIRCGDCEKVCPIELLPQQLYWFSQSEQWDPLEKQDLFDCIECGACAYVCPSEIPLVQYFKFGKSTIKNNRIKMLASEKAKQRFEFREMRVQRAKAERALKHKKAAEERRKAAQNKDIDPSGKQTAISAALERVKKKKAEAQQELTAKTSEQQGKK